MPLVFTAPRAGPLPCCVCPKLTELRSAFFMPIQLLCIDRPTTFVHCLEEHLKRPMAKAESWTNVQYAKSQIQKSITTSCNVRILLITRVLLTLNAPLLKCVPWSAMRVKCSSSAECNLSWRRNSRLCIPLYEGVRRNRRRLCCHR